MRKTSIIFTPKSNVHVVVVNVFHANVLFLYPLKTSENQRLGKREQQPPEVFHKKGVLKNLAIFTVKHLYQRFFFNKVAGLGLQLY